MDQLLLPYLQASNESERQQRLDELLMVHAAPVVRQALRRRLGFYVDQRGTNPHNQDAEDLYQEIMSRIVQALDDLRPSPENGIDDFRKYVAGVAGNVCRDYLRARSPARRRLKDNIRLVLTRHPDFALRQAEGEYLCGFSVWRERGEPPAWSQKTSALTEKIEEFRAAIYEREQPSRLPLAKILSDLFEWTSRPLELDTLVKIVAALMNVRDQPHERLDEHSEAYLESPAARETPSAQSRVEEKELLRQLWDTVKQLPAVQRDSYCFLFHDERGWDLFSLLIESEIVSFGDLAQALNRSPQEINRLRSQMPMDGPTAAAELHVTRPQVNKWRFLAIQRVRKAVGMFARKNKVY
jgi:RNA polymerase sigma factor (sigma-70 family)